ncbi:hypothetical protein Tco_0536268 [Tanacetum coccineum]
MWTIKIGDGQSTSFWNEKWIGDIPLRELFPRMFMLESVPNICVADKLVGSLDASFRRPVRGGAEQEQLSDLGSLLNPVGLSLSNDRWFYSLSSSGVFNVKDTRLAIDDLILPSYFEPTRWVNLIPIKINVFMWRARRDGGFAMCLSMVGDRLPELAFFFRLGCLVLFYSSSG